MIKRLLAKLRRPAKVETVGVRVDARRFTLGGGWGDAIQFTKDWDCHATDKISVVGWKTPKPRVGDLLFVPMQSGKNVVAVFIEIRSCGDPADMFFGEARALAYECDYKGPLPQETECDPFGGLRAKEALEAAMELRQSQLQKRK